MFWLSVALAEDIFDSLDTFADYSLQHFWCHQQKYGIRNSLGYTLRLRSYKSPLWNVWHAFMLSIFTWLLSVIIVSNLWFLLCTFDLNETLWWKLPEKSFSRKAWSEVYFKTCFLWSLISLGAMFLVSALFLLISAHIFRNCHPRNWFYWKQYEGATVRLLSTKCSPYSRYNWPGKGIL